ncbi:MAG TPA: DNA replication/repair protein RecF [Jiangellaceae bacterium]|nr:DNA replication/repair protein RecF [Jiangellaceae bacterium]
MHLTHLSVQDFRSYPTAELPLEPGVTSLLGPNGQGKTNLVEAVHFLASLGSHRVAQDAPLIRYGADRAITRATVSSVSDPRTTMIEVEINPGRSNRARINRSPVPRARDILGTIRTVLFGPEDLALVKGDPADRRRFLDEVLASRAPRYGGVRADYDRVLRQRNALLKSAGAALRSSRTGANPPDLSTLDVWDSHLATTGAELLAGRLELLAELSGLVASSYGTVAEADPAWVNLTYRSSIGSDVDLVPDRELLAKAIIEATSQRRKEELERGVSLVGPHRDDVVIGLGNLPAKGYASHGESWSLALALRLGSFQLLRGLGSDPVLILDDVFAELDEKRRGKLAGLAAEAEQVLVTAAVPDDVPDLLNGARVDVHAGELRRIR